MKKLGKSNETKIDEEILALFEARSEDAIAKTAEKYGGYCKAIAFRILGNEEDAEECVSDAYLRAWNAIPPARPGRLRLFLAKITRNLALHRHKKNSAAKRGGSAAKHGGREITAVLEELEECLTDGETPETALLMAELQKSMNEFVRTLPRREGDLFLRRYFFTEPISAIAARFGMRENAVTVSLCRTRGKLKKHLKKEGYLE